MPTKGQQVSEYILEELIGRGTFGEVWRARHHAWKREVAVKIPTDPQYIRQLQREGMVVHGLDHPGIVKAIGFNAFADPPYLISEYVPGTTLRELVGSVGVDDAVAIIRQILDALGHAHANGVIHRDLKPENVLIHREAATRGYAAPGMVKLTDFGLGKATAEVARSMVMSQSIEGAKVVGSLAYMAPEAKAGNAVAPSDVYSCGVVLFELLTGQLPEGLELPSHLKAGVPDCIDAAFARAIARLERRLGSAKEFAAALTPKAPRKTSALPRTAVPPAVATPQAALPSRVGETWTNSIGQTFAYIPAGTFMMGSPGGVGTWLRLLLGGPSSEDGRCSDERQHLVTLTRPFLLQTTPVTQAQWTAAMGTTLVQQRDRNAHKWALSAVGDKHPMYYVSWDEAVEFCRRLSEVEGRRYRLPTEAEWEYACRADAEGDYGGTGKLDEMGWFADNSGTNRIDSAAIWRGKKDFDDYAEQIIQNGCRTQPVGQKQPNVWGLHDMHGNVLEWCSDWYGPYPFGAVKDPTGATSGSHRVLRGGSWVNSAVNCRTAYRDMSEPGVRVDNIGFRPALSLEPLPHSSAFLPSF